MFGLKIYNNILCLISFKNHYLACKLINWFHICRLGFIINYLDVWFLFLKKIYFQCSDCQMMLDEKHTCFVREGKTFCKKDYIRCSWKYKNIRNLKISAYVSLLDPFDHKIWPLLMAWVWVRSDIHSETREASESSDRSDICETIFLAPGKEHLICWVVFSQDAIAWNDGWIHKIQILMYSSK